MWQGSDTEKDIWQGSDTEYLAGFNVVWCTMSSIAQCSD